MNIEDKAYFLFDTPGMSQKEKDKRAKYWLALEKQQAKKAMEDWRFAVAQEERYMGSVFVTPGRQREMEARTQAAYLKAKKLNPDYQGFSMPIEDKAYFDRRIYHSTGTFQTKLDKETRVPIDGTSKFVTVDPAQYITPKRVRISGIKGEIEIAAQLNGDEIKGISAKSVKAAAARQGSKAKFAKEYILWALPKGETDRLHERPIAEGLYTPAQVDEVKRKATAAGWHSFRVAAMMGFDDMTNAFKGKGIKKGSSRTGTKTKFANFKVGQIVKYKNPNSDEDPNQKYIIKEVNGDRGFMETHGGYFKDATFPPRMLYQQNEIMLASRTGTKTKFANRGAFAEASSSPVLGSLLEKKVMPEGGWRAVETDGAALVIAFEDNDIAGNFARRAAENGYSATAPMAMAGRFWNVKVQNENKN